MLDPLGRRLTWGAALLVGVAFTTLLGCNDQRGETSSADRGTGTERVTALDEDAHEVLDPDPGYEPRLQASPCKDPSVPTDQITCEVLVLPEDRDDPQGRQVELPVLRVRPVTPAPSTSAPSTSAPTTAGPTTRAPASTAPVVVLHGGPGGGVVDSWATWTTVLDDLGTELVLYDQRGGGAATPKLDCPEHSAALASVLGNDLSWEDERHAVGEALAACHDRLSDTGVDLDSYDTPTSTRDLEDLRQALGAEQMTLVASSYGTRLALDYLRTHQDHVRSLVLDGVDPPDASATTDATSAIAEAAEAAVDRLLDSCERDRACASAHPDLRAAIDRAVAAFDARPRRVTVDAATTDGSVVGGAGEAPGSQVGGSAVGGAQITMVLDGGDLYAGLYSAMYDTEVIPLLPSLIEAITGDDGTLLHTFAARALPALSSTSAGALLSVDCADAGGEGADGSDDVASQDPGRTSTILLTSSLPYCMDWPVEPVPRSFAAPVDPSAPPPTLVVAGELDPVTPASVARRVAEELDAAYLEVPRGGHSPLTVDACATRVLRSFLADPDAPDLGCVSRMKPRPYS